MKYEDTTKYGIDVQGWFDDDRGACLVELAKDAPGEIVELGTAWGKSASYILAGTDRSMTCVDIWDDADPMYGVGRTHSGQSAWEYFDNLLKKQGWTSRVARVRMSSQEAAKTWNAPIGLLHVDADHEYESVLSDYKSWSPFIVPGGHIVFDDMHLNGVNRVVTEEIWTDERWTDQRSVGVQWSARRSQT